MSYDVFDSLDDNDHSSIYQAKPTMYNEILFRSKLEAKWAVFLDNMQVQWKYEPFRVDLGYTSYTPDFVIEYPGSRLILEVKPIPIWASNWRKFTSGKISITPRSIGKFKKYSYMIGNQPDNSDEVVIVGEFRSEDRDEILVHIDKQTCALYLEYGVWKRKVIDWRPISEDLNTFSTDDRLNYTVKRAITVMHNYQFEDDDDTFFSDDDSDDDSWLWKNV